MHEKRAITGAAALAAAAISAPVAAQVIPFDTGRFQSAGEDVYRGVFGREMRIHTLTLGDATFRAEREEFVRPAAVRVSINRHDGRGWRVLSDRELAAGVGPVGFAFARDLRPEDRITSLDVMGGLDLSRLFRTDGTAAVRVDVLLSSPLHDDRPTETDRTPEVVVFGTFDRAGVGLASIVAGNVDDPVLAADPSPVEADLFAQGDTGLAMIAGDGSTYPLRAVGLDLSALRVQPDTPALGYRLEVPAGEAGVFTLFGAAFADQMLALQDPLIEEEREEIAATDLGASGGGGGGGGAISRLAPPVQVFEGIGRGGRGFSGTPGYPDFDLSDFFIFGPPPEEDPGTVDEDPADAGNEGVKPDVSGGGGDRDEDGPVLPDIGRRGPDIFDGGDPQHQDPVDVRVSANPHAVPGPAALPALMVGGFLAVRRRRR